MRLRRSVSPAAFRRVAWWALAAQIGIVVTGAAVRLTGSGLGCTDWPGCTEDRLVPEWGFHHWVEFGNRLLTFAVIATAAVATVAARRRQPYRGAAFGLSAVLVAGIVVQALIGAVLVVLELDPRLTVLHFATSVVLISAAVALVHVGAHDGGLQGNSIIGVDDAGDADRHDSVPPLPSAVGRLTTALGIAAGVVVATGTVVTGSGPHGGDERADRFGFALRNVTRLHSGAMWLFLALLVVLMVVVARSPRVHDLLRPNLTALIGLTVAQGVLGYVQYALGVPAGLVALHVLGSTLVWSAVVALVLKVRALTRAKSAGLHREPSGSGGQARPVLSEQ